MIAATLSWADLRASAGDLVPSQTGPSSAVMIGFHSSLRMVGSDDLIYAPASAAILAMRGVNSATFEKPGSSAAALVAGIPHRADHWSCIAGSTMCFITSQLPSWFLTPFQDQNWFDPP